MMEKVISESSFSRAGQEKSFHFHHGMGKVISMMERSHFHDGKKSFPKSHFRKSFSSLEMEMHFGSHPDYGIIASHCLSVTTYNAPKRVLNLMVLEPAFAHASPHAFAPALAPAFS